MKTTPSTLLKTIIAASLMHAAQAEYVDGVGSVYTPVGLGGNTFSEGWEALTSTAYPGNGSFPGNGAWTGALLSQEGPQAGTNGLVKVANGFAGGPYPASQSIYFGGILSMPNVHGGELAVQASGTGVLDDVKTIVFHVDIGEAWTYDFYNGEAPVLHVVSSTGTHEVEAEFTSLYAQVYNGEVYMNFKWEDLYINSWAFQYDLDGLGDVSSFSLEFHGVQHAQIHGLGLEQSDQAEIESVLPAEAE
ncbi:hypothetical protein OKA04_06640 [Luteolibacter flavescens]|uniref:PEP-CTERM sorting domain-containing protein n=1 Tax=Luteolibacter flavescens TaxID=1859460 RepID=A0ABT3FLF8_9BACT|nr:hypothetical protein [Luteolibacter flavescens]MCW1884402.1 hypothetical protein [Luteolibacter flavescens]